MQPVNRFTPRRDVVRQCGRASDWIVLAGSLEKLMTKTRKSGSHEAAMLSDSDIVPNTKSTAGSDCSLRDAELAGVSGGRVIPGGGFPLGVVYKPGVTIKTR